MTSTASLELFVPVTHIDFIVRGRGRSIGPAAALRAGQERLDHLSRQSVQDVVDNGAVPDLRNIYQRLLHRVLGALVFIAHELTRFVVKRRRLTKAFFVLIQKLLLAASGQLLARAAEYALRRREQITVASLWIVGVYRRVGVRYVFGGDERVHPRRLLPRHLKRATRPAPPELSDQVYCPEGLSNAVDCCRDALVDGPTVTIDVDARCQVCGKGRNPMGARPLLVRPGLPDVEQPRGVRIQESGNRHRRSIAVNESKAITAHGRQVVPAGPLVNWAPRIGRGGIGAHRANGNVGVPV